MRPYQEDPLFVDRDEILLQISTHLNVPDSCVLGNYGVRGPRSSMLEMMPLFT